MASIKEEPWKGGLMAGIFGILSFVLPVVVGSLEGVFYGVWMWGLYSASLEGITVTLFLPDNIGLIASIIILGSSIVICITIIKSRQLGRDKKIGIIWAILGAIILTDIILYLIVRWTIFIMPGASFHLAIYLTMWAGISALVSGILMIRTSTSEKEKSQFVIQKTDTYSQLRGEILSSLREKISYTCKSCGEELIKKADFCPHCGEPINNKQINIP